METIHTIEWMKQVARAARSEGHVLGLVPTMGALHEGHLSLVRAARQTCSRVVVSIFVNPKQFGPKEDFAKYPRQMEADRALLESLGRNSLKVDWLFAPTATEMYPEGFRTSVHVEGLSEALEGKSRPGHFRGVATVVLKLLEIVQPNFAYFGRKDAQQAAVLRRMARDLELDARLEICPIVREPDGLAMSSRNAYLKPDDRRAARVLHASLLAAQTEIHRGTRDALRITRLVRDALAAAPAAAPDYVEAVDAGTFEPVTLLRGNCLLVLAVFLGGVRLLDNMRIEEDSDGGLRCQL